MFPLGNFTFGDADIGGLADKPRGEGSCFSLGFAMIGIAMIPRGEVGLIFARMGLATGALTSQLYSAVALMVLFTTFMTPPLLAMRIGAVSSEEPHPDAPGGGGIDDLVAGTDQHRVVPRDD